MPCALDCCDFSFWKGTISNPLVGLLGVLKYAAKSCGRVIRQPGGVPEHHLWWWLRPLGRIVCDQVLRDGGPPVPLSWGQSLGFLVRRARARRQGVISASQAWWSHLCLQLLLPRHPYLLLGKWEWRGGRLLSFLLFVYRRCIGDLRMPLILPKLKLCKLLLKWR